MPENKILNKSLSELLKDDSLESKVDLISKTHSSTVLPLSLIKPNPFQPRTYFNKESIDELAESIKQYGVFTPIIVRKKDNGYEIVAGERRYKASILAELETIPAIIEHFSDQEMSEIALLENIQRENLTPLEIARAIQSYQQQYNLTQEELSRKFGKSRSYVANILRLLTLPKSVQKELEDGTLSAGHIRTLVGLNEDESKELIKEIKSKNLNVRDTELLIQKRKSSDDYLTRESNTKKLKDTLKTNITITNSEIKISYNSLEDLKKIVKLIAEKK